MGKTKQKIQYTQNDFVFVLCVLTAIVDVHILKNVCWGSTDNSRPQFSDWSPRAALCFLQYMTVL